MGPRTSGTEKKAAGFHDRSPAASTKATQVSYCTIDEDARVPPTIVVPLLNTINYVLP